MKQETKTVYKIAIDARRLRESTGRYSRELLNHLEQLDDTNEYHVIIHTKDQTHWVPAKPNFYLHVVPYDAYTFGEQLGFAQFLRKLKPDLVHFTMPQQPLLYFGKRITTIHDLTLVRFKNLDKNRFIYAIEQKIFTFLLKNVARRSKHIITPSDFVRDDVAQFCKISKNKITTTREAGVALTSVQPQSTPQLKGKEFILYVGNAFPHKNLERLIEAFILLKIKHPKLHLALAGKKEFFYEKLESSFGDVTNLHFLGFVDDSQLAWLYQHAQAYVFPSLSEGFGLPGIEVMQYETPLISSNATCLPEIYGDGAYYFDPTSVQSIAESVHIVLKSKTRQLELVKTATGQLKKYSWEKMTKQTHACYLKILS